MGKVFAEEGFTSIVKRSDGIYGYMDNINLAMKLFRMPFTILYTMIALNPISSINKQLVQKNFLHIYRYNDS